MIRGLLLAFCGCALLPLLASCGDDDGAAAATPSPAPSSAAGTATPGTSVPAGPIIDGPASKYSLLHEDVGQGYRTDILGTFVLDDKNYAKNKLFESPAEGERLLRDWKYAGGYETAVFPGGEEQALLQGRYTIYQEVHLFVDAAGAQGFYDYLEARLSANTGGAQAANGTVGDEMSVYAAIEGKIRDSSVDRALHQVIFRRGNFVGVVLTIGAEPFMKPDIPVGLARMMDEKVLGTRLATAPTPTSNWTPPAYSQTAPTAAGN